MINTTKMGSVFLALLLFLIGCMSGSKAPAVAETDPVVSAGQTVNVAYTCRFKTDGPVLATTSRDVASEEGYIKSALFKPPEKPGPVSVKAGTQNVTGIESKKFILNLEEYIQEALAEKIVGMPLGTTRTLTLRAEPQTHVSRDERILQLATVRKRPRKVTVSREYFDARYPVKAEKGKKMPIFRDELSCTITDVTEKTVTYECEPLDSSGKTMTPFGPATFEETDEGYDLVLHPKAGDLIRTAGMIGRISEVGPKVFTIDYTEPFGGKPLHCRITLTAPEKQAESNGKTVKTDEKKAADASASDKKSAKSPESNTVAPGDLIQVSYTARLKDGRIVQTTDKAVAEDESLEKVESFSTEGGFGPEMVIAGKAAGFKGVGQAVVGMKDGTSRQVTLPPEEAFGPISKHKVVEIPRVKSFQKKVHIQARDYVKRFDAFPNAGEVVDVNQYLEGEIAEIRDNAVLMDLRPKKGEFREAFGRVTARETDAAVEVVLDPEIGAEFKQDEHTGRIVSVDEDGFEVNFNHPLAGKEIVLDLSVSGLTRKSELPDAELEWEEDYAAGLNTAGEKEKPVVLVLYSQSCGWCKKLLTRTMTDPRVTRLKDDYVWVKADANEKRELADKYELKSFPLTVLLNPEGKVMKRLSGYRNAADMGRELGAALEMKMAGK